jgi:hypothetical protein
MLAVAAAVVVAAAVAVRSVVVVAAVRLAVVVAVRPVAVVQVPHHEPIHECASLQDASYRHSAQHGD